MYEAVAESDDAGCVRCVEVVGCVLHHLHTFLHSGFGLSHGPISIQPTYTSVQYRNSLKQLQQL